MGRSGSPGRRPGCGPRSGSRASWRTPGSRRRPTQPATSGSRSRAAPSERSDRRPHRLRPNGGWLDGALNVVAGVEVLRRIAEEGSRPSPCGSSTGPTRRAPASAARSSARARLRAPWPIRTSSGACTDADGGTRRRPRRARGRPRRGARSAPATRERGRLPGAPHRAGAGARGHRPAARRRPRHLRRRAPPDHVPGPGRARRLDADGQAPGCARRRREARPRDPRDRRATGDGPSARWAAV